MIRIRGRQLKILGAECTGDFERQVAQHLKRFFPHHCESLGERQLRVLVAYGRERAKAHGLTTKRNAAVYITLMPLLGSNFDGDLLLPWAAETLTDPRVPAAEARVDRLADRAMDYLDRIVGVGDAYLDETLARLHDALTRVAAPTGSFDKAALACMKDLFPRKCDAVGEVLLSRLIEHGRREGRRRGMLSDHATLTLVLFMFVLGTTFDADPQLPWAAGALADASHPTPEAQIEHLRGAAIDELKRRLELRSTRNAPRHG